MKLKTVKDLGNECILRGNKCCVPHHSKELKKEAIKWVKQAQEKLKKEKDKEAIWFVKGGIEVLKRFCNLGVVK